MFTLADFGVYVAIIAALGEAGIDAVTTNLNINFLAKPEARTWWPRSASSASAAGWPWARREIYSDGAADMVAHAIATYALPARSR